MAPTSGPGLLVAEAARHGLRGEGVAGRNRLGRRRAAGAGRWLGLAGGSKLGRGEREKEGAGWAGLLGFGLGSVLSSFLFQTKLKPFEFKLEFELNSSTQTNKTMHQHECNNKVKPKKNFNYYWNKN